MPDQRYERELHNVERTADKVIMDATEAHDQGVIDEETRNRIGRMADEYRESTTKLLRALYPGWDK